MSRVAPATSVPCGACPWRTSNHGKPHPDGWYTKRNRQRLWAGMRRGEAMTCHPTDPNNPIPEGARPVPEGTTTHECAGALVLQQREAMVLQEVYGSDLRAYRRARPRGLTRDGIAEIVSRFLFAGTPFGGLPMAKPDLNEPCSVDGLDWPLGGGDDGA